MTESPVDPPDGPSAERRLLQHVENTPLAVIEWDRDFRVTRWNAQAERLFGWAAAEVTGKTPYDWRFVHDADRAEVERLMAEMVAGRRNQNVMTNRNYTRDGRVVWCEWHNSVLYAADGKMAWALSLVLDVTDRRAAADALALSEARVRAALDGAKMLAWDLDLVNNRWHTTVDIPDFYGVEPGPDYTDPVNALRAVHPDDVPTVLAGRRRAVETGEPLRYEFRGRVAADGRPRWFSTRGQVLRDDTGTAVRIVAVTTDVTERKRAEEERDALNRQLHDAQRWESLGVLAGGIAHDFNNILTIVLGSAGLVRRDLPAGAAAAGYLDQIESACRRAADVCRQMLAYAGRSQGLGARTDLAGLVRAAAPLLDAAALHAPVRIDVGADLPVVQADPAQVRQVLVNLVTNAAEAGGAGEIVIALTAAEVADGEADAKFHVAPTAGRHVVLTVSDRGPGMTADVRARMFDPFFSTKFAGRGLGLAAVQGIVRAHRGGIRVSTTPGRGTAVSVYWPVSPPPVTPPVPVPVPVPRAVPTVAALVIDDEVFVREVTASILEEMGYTPLAAADGPAGLALFAAHRDTVRVAVIDVTMPGMTGDAVLRALRQLSPELPAVLMSGFTAQRLLGAVLGPRTEFLQKPFRPEDLMAAVRRLIQ